jgi:hypothetical protein
MRKLESREQAEKKKKRKVMFMSLIMLAIMLFGTIGFAFSFTSGGTPQQSNEGSVENAANSGRQASINFNGQEIFLQFDREYVENIGVGSYKTINSYAGQPLYLITNNSGAYNELAFSIGLYASRVQRACLGECEEDLPAKDCTSNLIIWEDSEENRVYEEENCVFIEGDLRAVDAFIYSVFQQY